MQDHVANSNVLIVDDISENIQILASILGGYDIQISYANNGQQALEIINYQLPDLILLDISMPIMNGYEVCEKLKEDSKTKDIPVIFLTAKNQIDDIVKGLNMGAVDYITKPFNHKELISRVSTHLELKKSRDMIKDQNEQILLQNDRILDQNEEITNQNNQLSELNETKDKLFSVIAHDLKNPFQVVIMFSKMLLGNPDKFAGKKMIQYLQSIYNASMSGFSLLENLLNWSRSQMGGVNFHPENVKFIDLVNKNEELLSTQYEAKKIKIINEINPDTYAFADINMLTTVVRNLMSNALKFTPTKGQITISSRIASENSTDGKEMLEFVIKDTGVGIASENIEKIFFSETYFTTYGTDNEQGTGLGLILCKEFVEKNGGKIRVESQVNVGSSFIFTLPKSSSDIS